MNSEHFVETGIQMGWNKKAPHFKNKKNGYLFDYIISTRDKNMYFHRQDRIFYDNDTKAKKSNEKTQVCLSMFKSHAEVDLIELKRV